MFCIFAYTLFILLNDCMKWLHVLFIRIQTMLVLYICRYVKKHFLSPPYEIFLVKETTTWAIPNDRTFSSHNISPLGDEDILVEESINESSENPSCFSSFTYLSGKNIHTKHNTTLDDHDNNIFYSSSISPSCEVDSLMSDNIID